MNKKIFLIISFVLIFSLVIIAINGSMGKNEKVKKSGQRADTERIKKWDFNFENREGWNRSQKKFEEVFKKEKFNEEDIEFIEQGLRQNNDRVLRGFFFKELYPRFVSIKEGDKWKDKRKYLPRDKQCIKILKDFITDKSWKNKQFYEYIDKADTNTQYNRSKFSAILILGWYEDKSIIPFLKNLLKTETDTNVRAITGQVLYNLGEKEIGYQVYEYLIKNDYNFSMVYFDFKGDLEAKPMLFRTLKYNNPYAQLVSIWNLAKLGEKGSVIKLYKKLKEDFSKKRTTFPMTTNQRTISRLLSLIEEQWEMR